MAEHGKTESRRRDQGHTGLYAGPKGNTDACTGVQRQLVYAGVDRGRALLRGGANFMGVEAIGIRPTNNKRLGSCPRCKKPLTEWFGLGGKKYVGCSDLTCGYRRVAKG